MRRQHLDGSGVPCAAAWLALAAMPALTSAQTVAKPTPTAAGLPSGASKDAIQRGAGGQKKLVTPPAAPSPSVPKLPEKVAAPMDQQPAVAKPSELPKSAEKQDMKLVQQGRETPPTSYRKPYDCGRLGDPASVRWLNQNLHGSWRRQPEKFLLIYHAATNTFERLHSYTYPNALVMLCIADLDYRLHHRLNVNAVALPPAPSPSILPTGTPAPVAAKTTAPSPGESTARSADAQKSQAAVENHTNSLVAQEPATEKASTVAQLRSVLEPVMNTDAKHHLSDLATVIEKDGALFSAQGRELQASASMTEQAVNRVSNALREVTGEIPVLRARAEALTDSLVHSRAELNKYVSPVRDTAALSDLNDGLNKLVETYGKSIAEQKKVLRNVTERLDKLPKSTEKDDLLVKAKSLATILEPYDKTSSKFSQEQVERQKTLDQHDASHTQAQAERVAQSLLTQRAILNHFAVVDQNVFFIPVEKEKELEVVLSSERLSLGKVAGSGGSGKEDTKNEDPKTGQSQQPAQAQLKPSLRYEAVTGSEARHKFQVRSLTYLRINIGVGYTSLRNPGYVFGPNDNGAQVITKGNDPGLFPFILLSHYWCGVDLREIQPWHRFNRCGKFNTFLPTFALGIPLSKSPIENFFVGSMWQPVPGIGFTAGAHIGQVRMLKDEFVEGQSLSVGQSLSESQIQENKTRLGYFIGAVITDSLFVPIIARLAGLNN